jgi:uncharacterized membrane protein YsdA (DUF1294 family)
MAGRAAHHPHRNAFLAGASATAAGTVALAVGLDWPWLWAYLAAVNPVTFGVYVWDKAAARHRRGRIPERQLHILALAGGSPAALLARHTLRHKTVKGPFRLVFWTVCIVQLAGLGIWLWLRHSS